MKVPTFIGLLSSVVVVLLTIPICASPSTPPPPPTSLTTRQVLTTGMCTKQAEPFKCMLGTLWTSTGLLSLYAFRNTCALIGYMPKAPKKMPFDFYSELKYSIVVRMYKGDYPFFSYGKSDYHPGTGRKKVCWLNESKDWVCQMSFNC
jgi:hypothetical protein